MLGKNFEPELQEYTSAGQALSILVVDDSKVVRTAIRERLELGNLEVIEASSGEQALELVVKQVPDLVLLDVVMPGLDGITVLKILRNTYSKQQLPIIPVTSIDSSSEIVQALDFGANDYITKPIDFDVLWARLTNQLMQKQAAEYLRYAQASLEQQIRHRTAELNTSNQKLKRVIQERLLTEDRLQRQANYDELTGLPNRSLAKDRLRQTIAKAKRQNLSPCVAFLDLDNFKYVNDTLGHAAGDELLTESAKRLSACARKSDTVARLGGDEFLLILEDSDKEPRGGSRALDIRHVGERIIESFSKPFVLDGTEVGISPSLGFAIFPMDGADGSELIRNADAAMYRAKKDGKNIYCFYSAEMTAKAKMRMNVESQLRYALERDELYLHYQPIVDVHSGEIIKAEALLRWHNCELGMISPEYFIKVAEDTGLIVPIGDWVIQTVCKQVRKWRDTGSKQLSVTVNVSSRQFQSNSDYSKIVANALNENGLQADALQLELTEAVMLRESPATIESITELEKIGIKMLIDNFGTGYASLSCLQRYHFDSVKIDRSYIKNVESNIQDAKLINAIVTMANSLGISVISEGVETSGQMGVLLDINCQYAQGLYFSKPVPVNEFEALLSRRDVRCPRRKPLELVSSSAISCSS